MDFVLPVKIVGLWKFGSAKKDCRKLGSEGLNQALLVKQAWHIATQPNSLLHQLLKAKYFPNEDFFLVDVGRSSSFTWKGIFEVLVEAYVAKEAVSMLQQMGFHEVVIEGDLQVVNDINCFEAESDSSDIGVLVADRVSIPCNFPGSVMGFQKSYPRCLCFS
ncbi:hypothetical protein ACH5RR_032807 [Cinchona calisaya]|uniref:Uncharacterized protein n=1 Tax=Cinchona calisaya TaxID=153742 RepID=A0ABD2YJ57_9GENT